MSEPNEAPEPQTDATVSPETAPPDGAAQQTENAADPSSAAEGKSSDKTIEPETNRINERFAELTKHRREAEREREFWRDRALRLEQAQQAPKPTPLPDAPGPDKTLADFNFDEVAYRKYEREQLATTAVQAAERKLRAEDQQREEQRLAASYVKRAKDFAKEHTDYNEVAHTAPISDTVAKMLVRSEQGPELAYYLGKNPDIAAEISRLPESAASFELGGIAFRLKTEREAAAKAKLKVSAAPPPPPTIEGARDSMKVSSASDPDSDKLTPDQWRKLREKELRKGRSTK